MPVFVIPVDALGIGRPCSALNSLTVLAPAAGWRPKPLVHHVEMESVNAILHHFGEQRHPIPIGRVEANQIINRFAVGPCAFPFPDGFAIHMRDTEADNRR